MKGVNRKQVWIDETTGRRSSVSREGWKRFDSTLEADIYRHMKRLELPFIDQHPIELVAKPKKLWKADFFLPTHNLIVECKGAWIVEKFFADKLALFDLQLAIAESKGYSILLIGDREFKARKHTVLNKENGKCQLTALATKI